MKWRETIGSAFDGWRLASITLMLALFLISSWFNAKDELARVDFPKFAEAFASVTSLMESESHASSAEFIEKFLVFPRNQNEASAFYSNLSDICAEMSEHSRENSEYLAVISANFAEESKFYANFHAGYLNGMLWTMGLTWAGPIAVILLYLIGSGVTKNPALNYTLTLAIISLNALIFVLYALNGPTTGINSSPQVHIILVPILLAIPTTIVLIGMFVRLVLSKRKSMRSDPVTVGGQSK